MNCPECFGTGKVKQWVPGKPGKPEQVECMCDECMGFGVIHCCDGDIACADWDDIPSE